MSVHIRLRSELLPVSCWLGPLLRCVSNRLALLPCVPMLLSVSRYWVRLCVKWAAAAAAAAAAAFAKSAST